MNNLVPSLKSRMVFGAWIAGILLAAALLWSLSFPFRASCLMRVTNKVLASMNDERRLSAPLTHLSARAVPLGCWYSLAESSSLFLVFTVMRGGILIPCGAEIAESGEIVEMIPLGSHARQVMEKTPRAVLQLYVRRIETTAGRER